jgi:hypothetical protein
MISLTASLQTCKVNTGWANKVQSDRFFNPQLVVCPAFNGTDNYGRYVCPDSYYSKAAGCDSAMDRVDVENFLRPQYFEYITLDAAGLQGNDNMDNFGASIQRATINDINTITGRVGIQNQGTVQVACPYNAYADAQAQLNTMQRGAEMNKATYKAQQAQTCSGGSIY